MLLTPSRVTPRTFPCHILTRRPPASPRLPRVRMRIHINSSCMCTDCSFVPCPQCTGLDVYPPWRAPCVVSGEATQNGGRSQLRLAGWPLVLHSLCTARFTFHRKLRPCCRMSRATRASCSRSASLGALIVQALAYLQLYSQRALRSCHWVEALVIRVSSPQPRTMCPTS